MRLNERLNMTLTGAALIAGAGLSAYVIAHGNGSPVLYVVVAVGLVIWLGHLFYLISMIRDSR